MLCIQSARTQPPTQVPSSMHPDVKQLCRLPGAASCPQPLRPQPLCPQSPCGLRFSCRKRLCAPTRWSCRTGWTPTCLWAAESHPCLFGLSQGSPGNTGMSCASLPGGACAHQSWCRGIVPVVRLGPHRGHLTFPPAGRLVSVMPGPAFSLSAAIPWSSGVSWPHFSGGQVHADSTPFVAEGHILCLFLLWLSLCPPPHIFHVSGYSEKRVLLISIVNYNCHYFVFQAHQSFEPYSS